jgi:hypothetical protein
MTGIPLAHRAPGAPAPGGQSAMNNIKAMDRSDKLPYSAARAVVSHSLREGNRMSDTMLQKLAFFLLLALILYVSTLNGPVAAVGGL